MKILKALLILIPIISFNYSLAETPTLQTDIHFLSGLQYALNGWSSSKLKKIEKQHKGLSSEEIQLTPEYIIAPMVQDFFSKDLRGLFLSSDIEGYTIPTFEVTEYAALNFLATQCGSLQDQALSKDIIELVEYVSDPKAIYHPKRHKLYKMSSNRNTIRFAIERHMNTLYEECLDFYKLAQQLVHH